MKTKILTISLAFSALLFWSCEEKELNVFRLDNMTKIYNTNDLDLSETVVIEGKIPNEQELDRLINDYLLNESLLLNIDTFTYNSKKIGVYLVAFFKRTRCVEYYIRDGTGMDYEIYGDGTGQNRDCSKDCLGFYFYYRSEEDSTMWYCHYPKERKDTIYVYDNATHKQPYCIGE